MVPFAAPWLLSLAWAQDVPWYVDRPVAQVTLSAPEGGLPDEHLEPLLEVRQGEELNLADVRNDIALLMRIGQFLSVEAHAEPWPTFDAEGNPLDGVHLVYDVRPPLRLERIAIEGVRGSARQVATDAVEIGRGDPFDLAADGAAVAQRVTRALADAGWPASTARVDLEGTTLMVQVRPGGERRYTDVAFVGLPEGLRERTVRRVLRRKGVTTGNRVQPARVVEAREDLIDAMVDQRWLQARVNMVLTPVGNDEKLTVVVEPGPRLEVAWFASRDALVPREDARLSILGVGRGERISSVVEEEASLRVQAWAQARGFVDADARVVLTESTDDVQRLAVSIQGGAKVLLAEHPKSKGRARIAFRGNETVTDKTLDRLVREAEAESLGRGFVAPGALDDALRRIEDYYRGRGYLAAEATLAEENRRRGTRHDRLRVAIAVEEGVRTDLVEVRAVGGTGIEAEVLARQLGAMLDAPYNPASLEGLAARVADVYRDRGYLDVKVDPQGEVDATGRRAAITLGVQPGPQVRMRALVVQGNQRLRRRAIAREVPVQIGEVITPSDLGTLRTNLYDLQVFRGVAPVVVGDGAIRDLVVRVEEMPNIFLEAGGGAATDQGVRLTARAAHRNLFGLAHRLSFQGQAGYAWVGEGFTIDFAAPVWRAAVRYEAPHLPGGGQRFFVEGLINEVVQEPTFRMSRSGAVVGVRFRFSDTLEVVTDYGVQVRRMEDLASGTVVRGDPWLGDVGLGADYTVGDVPKTPSSFRTVGVLSAGVVWDERNDRFNPTSGVLLTGQAQLFDGLWSNPLAARGQGTLETLVPIGPLVADLVVGGGLTWVPGLLSTVGPEDRFFLGGAATVRGMRLDTLGPANLVRRPDVPFPSQLDPAIDGMARTLNPNQWTQTGGEAMALVSFELRIPFPVLGLQSYDTTALALFSDVGHISFLDPAITTTSLLLKRDPFVRATVGVGVRVATPIGPAMLDIGINPAPLAERDEPLILPHVSIGAL